MQRREKHARGKALRIATRKKKKKKRVYQCYRANERGHGKGRKGGRKKGKSRKPMNGYSQEGAITILYFGRREGDR